MHVRVGNRTRAPRHPGTAKAAARRLRGRVPEPVVAAGEGISPSLARRVLDVAVAVAILGLVWPLFLALVVATRLSTGGSASYRHRRVGQGGIPFTLYKVRTMRAETAGPEATAPRDARVTRHDTHLRQ